MNWNQKDGALTQKRNESIILASKSLNFPSFTMGQASLFCGECVLFSTYLPPTKPTYWKWSLQLDFKLQELPVKEIFFCIMLSLKWNLFSRIYKYYLWSRWKQNTYLAECSMKASKSKGKQVGESKGQDIKLMARRQEFTELSLLLGSQVLPRSPRLLWAPVERDGIAEVELSRPVQVSVGGEMNCHVMGQCFFHFSEDRIWQLLHIFKLQNNSIHQWMPMLQQYANYFFSPSLLIAKC